MARKSGGRTFVACGSKSFCCVPVRQGTRARESGGAWEGRVKQVPGLHIITGH